MPRDHGRGRRPVTLLQRQGEHGPQVLVPDGFGGRGGEAELLEAAGVAAPAQGGQQHHPGIGQARVGPDGSAQGLAVHPRHLQVDQRQAEGVVLRQRLGERLERAGAVGYGDWAQAPGGQAGGQEIASGGAIVNEQGAYALQVRRRTIIRRGFPGLPTQAHGEPELGALALDTLHPDLAAHQLCQLFRDRQAEAAAAVLAGDRGIHLGELAKDQLELVSRHADTRIEHREAQEDVLSVPFPHNTANNNTL